MDKTLLIIGIIITSLGALAITIFSVVNFILNRVYKEERKTMSEDEKKKEKLIKRGLKGLKKILKTVNKKLVQNLWAFYSFTTVAVVGGVTITTVGAVQMHVNAAEKSSTSSSEESSISSIIESSESSSSSEESSSIISSSEEISSSIEESSSDTSTSSEETDVYFTVTYHIDDKYQELPEFDSFPLTEKVKKGEPAPYKAIYAGGIEGSVMWYSDSGYTMQYDFGIPVTEDTDIYGTFLE